MHFIIFYVNNFVVKPISKSFITKPEIFTRIEFPLEVTFYYYIFKYIKSALRILEVFQLNIVVIL